MYTVGDLRDGVAGLLTGTNLDKVNNLYGAFERAARKLARKADVPEATVRHSLNLYDGVFDNPMNELIFGGALIDLRPDGVSRNITEDVVKRPVKLFDRTKHYVSGYEVSFEWDKGVPIARIASTRQTPRVIVDLMNATTGWTAGGSASGLTLDETTYYESVGSLKFTLTGSSTGTLTKTLSQSLSMASYENVGVAFLAIRIPDGATASDLTSIALKLGSSDSAYDEVSNTTGFLGAWQAGKFLLVALDFSGATSTGTPDWSAINYVQVSLAHTGTLTNFRLGGLWIALPSPHEMIFQTSAIFLLNSNSTLSKTIGADEDKIILNDDAYNIFEHEAALAVAIQGKSKESIKSMRQILYGGEGDEGLYASYKADNPSQELRVVGSYYDV